MMRGQFPQRFIVSVLHLDDHPIFFIIFLKLNEGEVETKHCRQKNICSPAEQNIAADQVWKAELQGWSTVKFICINTADKLKLGSHSTSTITTPWRIPLLHFMKFNPTLKEFYEHRTLTGFSGTLRPTSPAHFIQEKKYEKFLLILSIRFLRGPIQRALRSSTSFWCLNSASSRWASSFCCLEISRFLLL